MEFNDALALSLPKIDPRGDVSGVSREAVDFHIARLVAIFERDEDEYRIADALREYVKDNLYPIPETYFVVNDELAARKIISKAQFKNYLSLVLLVE